MKKPKLLKRDEEKIAELSSLRRGLLNEVTALRNLTQDEQLYQRLRGDLVKRRDRLNADIEDLDDRYLRGAERIAQYEERAKTLLRATQVLKNRRQLEELQKLQGKIRELQEAGVLPADSDE